MFGSPYQIQFGATFVVFLIWFINKCPSVFFQSRGAWNSASSNSSRPIGNNPTGGPTPGVRSDPDFPNETSPRSIFGPRAEASDHALFQAFVMLAIGVILNVIGAGNLIAGDVFSLIIMVDVIIIALLFYLGKTVGGHICWSIVHLSLLGLYITPWATY